MSSEMLSSSLEKHSEEQMQNVAESDDQELESAEREERGTMESQIDENKDAAVIKEIESEISTDDTTNENVSDVKPVIKKSAKRGLLDAPVLMEGKRKRHTVERLSVATVAPVKKVNLGAVGTGVPLGNIEYVNTYISKQYSDSLKALHKLCFGTLGIITTRKRELRKFNGYNFKENSAEFEKKKVMAMKLTSAEVNAIGKSLGTERGHTKEDMVMHILRFLLKPSDTGKKVQETKKRRSSKSSQKSPQKAKTEKKAKGAVVKKKSNRKRKEIVKADKNDEESSDESEKEEENDQSDSNDESVKEKLKSDESPSKEMEREASESSDQSNESSEVSVHDWGVGGPTDEEIDAAIHVVLDEVDFKQFTMKQTCERVVENFPALDLDVHKSALKARIKAVLATVEDARFKCD